MEIVIKIDKEKYKAITEMYGTFPKEMKDWGVEAIKNGTPLPEHHGRIIDESKINRVFYATEETINNNIKHIGVEITHTDAPTIIEAESEELDYGSN